MSDTKEPGITASSFVLPKEEVRRKASERERLILALGLALHALTGSNASRESSDALQPRSRLKKQRGRGFLMRGIG